MDSGLRYDDHPMDLKPRHYLPIVCPVPWPHLVLSWVRSGAAWLRSGEDGEGDDLLGLPGGPVLETRWSGTAWTTTLEGQPVSASPWAALERAVRSRDLPWVGAATFELACAEAGLPHQPPEPGALGQRWQGFETALRRHGDGGFELWSWEAAPPHPEAWRPGEACGIFPAAPSLDLAPCWEEDRHRASVEAIQARILEGGFYVANLCVPFEGRLDGQAEALAVDAFQRARPPFGALLDLGDLRLVSLSMERLLSRRGDRLVSQPIKGTILKSGDAHLDAEAGRTLAADPKERAEHTMIVDLVRNDLGRVARTGSVQVPRLMAVKPYPTVQHLVSTVEALARPGLGLADLLRSILPGGSVTGAPKHAVCAHLAQVEAGPRGFYCGALGWIAPDGDLDLALPIRTAQIVGDRVTYWAGGGITRRSEPAREWAELRLKTRAITG